VFEESYLHHRYPAELGRVMPIEIRELVQIPPGVWCRSSTWFSGSSVRHVDPGPTECRKYELLVGGLPKPGTPSKSCRIEVLCTPGTGPCLNERAPFEERLTVHIGVWRVQSPPRNNPHRCRPTTPLGTRHRARGATEFDQHWLLGSSYRPRLNT